MMEEIVERKYELIKTRKDSLYRIKALRDFSDVKKGDLGGFVESENNLSHDGNCWIYDNAKLLGDARVKENAKIRDHVVVYGHAVIYGNAEILGSVQIYDSIRFVRIFDNTLVFGGPSSIKTYYDSPEIYDNAIICDKVRISGSPKIYGNVVICDEVRISDSPRIHGNAVICDKVQVCGNSQIYGETQIWGKSVVSSGEFSGNEVIVKVNI